MSIPTILIHGGAGVIQPDKFTPEWLELYRATLCEIVCAGQQRLLAGESAVDAVAYAVTLLEDSPLFNAGTGSVLTAGETIEMDACIMDGRDKSAGAVTLVSRLKNPILVAQKVMTESRHVCLGGAGVEQFACENGFSLVEMSSLIVEERRAQLKRMRVENQISLDHDAEDKLAKLASDGNPIREKDKYGTVGAVALDQYGNLAAATSTGGMTNQAMGRIGDTPIVGAGCYADRTVAVSTTGIGEAFMRGVVAHDISARMRYGGETLVQAANHAVSSTLTEVGGEGGLIAVDQHGNIALPMNTTGMYRAQAIGNHPAVAAIFAE